ncbi:hypothetical protein [Niallia sp. Krafla_26]|uniref:hypothetical protein n=1 Tax=Niallia sp. Krafla_26 TaxID=3064703 RepID=UPI003D17246A
MINKIKALPKKAAFGIGMTLIFVSGFLLPNDNWTEMIIKGVIFGIAFIFIAAAADKNHSRKDQQK